MSAGVRKLEVSSVVAAEDVRDLLMSTISEKEFTQMVKDKAEDLGWLVFHAWRSDHSPAGFPDLCMVRDARLVFAELKTMRSSSKLSRKQEQWIGRLVAAGQNVYVWRPSDYETVCEVLT